MKPTKMILGLSLVELLASLAILGLLVAIVVPRLTARHSASESAACNTYRGNIEIQAEIWRTDTGSWPLGDLSDIGAHVHYFPEGVPSCPVDGSEYTIDSSTGRVMGHNH